MKSCPTCQWDTGAGVITVQDPEGSEQQGGSVEASLTQPVSQAPGGTIGPSGHHPPQSLLLMGQRKQNRESHLWAHGMKATSP